MMPRLFMKRADFDIIMVANVKESALYRHSSFRGSTSVDVPLEGTDPSIHLPTPRDYSRKRVLSTDSYAPNIPFSVYVLEVITAIPSHYSENCLRSEL